MIIEVGIGDEEPRRYEVVRRGGNIMVRGLVGQAKAGGNAAGAATSVATAIDWRRPQPGIYSLLVDDASYEVFIDDNADDLGVHLVNRSFRIGARDVRRHRGGAMADAVADGVVRICAPIPGRITRVLVSPGQTVERGAGMIVVEAMKMENELRAPRDGVVGVVEVEEGQGVEGGALLATIE